MRRTGILLALAALAAAGATARPPGPKRIALTSRAAAPPVVEPDPPPGPGADSFAANCIGCHGASMVLTQPRLTPAQWEATVRKMREAYKAPIPEADLPAILAYLNALGAGGTPR